MLGSRHRIMYEFTMKLLDQTESANICATAESRRKASEERGIDSGVHRALPMFWAEFVTLPLCLGVCVNSPQKLSILV